MRALEMIAAERGRQVEQGYTEAHDDAHRDGSLAAAAECYLSVAAIQIRTGRAAPACFVPRDWPWERQDWKNPADPVDALVKAAALLAAEADRLLRLRK